MQHLTGISLLLLKAGKMVPRNNIYTKLAAEKRNLIFLLDFVPVTLHSKFKVEVCFLLHVLVREQLTKDTCEAMSLCAVEYLLFKQEAFCTTKLFIRRRKNCQINTTVSCFPLTRLFKAGCPPVNTCTC